MAANGPSAWRRAGVWLFLATLFFSFVALGIWQIQRRAWKLALIERVDQRVHAAPVALPPPAQWAAITADSHEYLPVTVRGHWLASKTLLSQAVTELGAGFWVMTPLQQSDGSSVWINRGFIPDAQRKRWQASPAALVDRTSAQVTGLLRMSEPDGGFLRQNDPAQGRWHSRDVLAMAQAQGLSNASPFFIDAGLPGASATSTGAGVWPRPSMTVIRFHNSHLVYVLTWFGLAALTAFGGVLVWRHQRAAVGG